MSLLEHKLVHMGGYKERLSAVPSQKNKNYQKRILRAPQGTDTVSVTSKGGLE